MPHLAPDRLFLDFQAAVAGRYSLERELGRGGMGVVYLAREVRLDRPVAIKLLPPSKASDPKLRERFLREARTAAKLSHPNVIPIHAVEEIGEFVFFAMAYIEGETLTERVRNRGPLAPSEASRVLRDVAWALAYAHGQGVIHRDVKPDNILLENNGRVLVADFGIAGNPTGNSELGHEHAAVVLEQDVVRLHVPMDDALSMGVGERPGDVAQHTRCFGGRERPAPPHPLRQSLALDVRHREKHELADLFDGVNRDDVGMGKIGRRACLTQEPLAELRIRRLRRR